MNFFKDRHYLQKWDYFLNNFKREIPELTTFAQTEEEKVICELGCGVGNVIFPL